MTRYRSISHEVLALLVCVSVAAVPACSGRALILDGAPPSPTGTADASAIETLTLPDEAVVFGVDDARLYWGNLSEQWRSCLHDDCEHTAVTYSSRSFSFVWGEHDVFWMAEPDTVMSCPKAGCQGSPTSVVKDPYLMRLVGDGDYVYWSSAFDTYRCPSTGCGDFPETVVHGEAAFDLVVEGSRAYWSRGIGAANDATSASEIRSAPKDGSGPATTVYTVPSLSEFVVDATTLYWIDGSNQVLSCPLEHCSSQPPTLLATSDHLKSSLTVDAAGLYWVERGTSDFNIEFCPLIGCGAEPRTLVAGTGSNFALDSTYVYFQSSVTVVSGLGYLGSKTINRMRKPTP